MYRPSEDSIRNPIKMEFPIPLSNYTQSHNQIHRLYGAWYQTGTSDSTCFYR